MWSTLGLLPREYPIQLLLCLIQLTDKSLVGPERECLIQIRRTHHIDYPLGSPEIGGFSTRVRILVCLCHIWVRGLTCAGPIVGDQEDSSRPLRPQGRRRRRRRGGPRYVFFFDLTTGCWVTDCRFFDIT